MSAICVLTPVVIAAWPAVGAAILSAAQSLGYSVVEHEIEEQRESESTTRVNLQIEQSEVVTDRIARGNEITVTKDGITVRFSKDPRGKAALCVSGDGYSEEALKQAGEQLSQRVVQKYVYQRLMQEMEKRQYVVVEDQVEGDETIHLKVRHWEN